MNKLNELNALVQMKNPGVVGICETHTYSDIPNSIICPQGYSIDRNKYGGGVAFLVCIDI